MQPDVLPAIFSGRFFVHELPNEHTGIPGGSRETCNPAPTDTDADWLGFLSIGSLSDVAYRLEDEGWEGGGSIDADVDRATFRKDDDNLILTTSRPFYDSFVACTAIAKRMNLLRKEDRVALFDECRKHWPGLKRETTEVLGDHF